MLGLHDVLGLSEMTLKFTKRDDDLRKAAIQATEQYIADVREGVWPDDAHSFH